MAPTPIALDTNVLVRFLVRDDAEQCAAVVTLLDARERDGTPVHVPITVILETEWVLRSRYLRSRKDIVRAFGLLLAMPVLAIESEAALENALHLLRINPSASFADCLHIACAQRLGATLATFDVRASQLPGACQVETAIAQS